MNKYSINYTPDREHYLRELLRNIIKNEYITEPNDIEYTVDDIINKTCGILNIELVKR